MASPIVFTIKGLDDIARGFKALKQPELTRTAKPAYAEASKKVLIPEIKKMAPRGPSPHRSAARGTRGKKGPLSRNVTTRLMKKSQIPASVRANVLFAYGTSPRAWYRHFVIKGTQRHSVAKGADVKKNLRQDVPPIHPGARPDDFVARAQTRGQAPFVTYISGALMHAYKTRSRAK
jgi:hypothetical protein